MREFVKKGTKLLSWLQPINMLIGLNIKKLGQLYITQQLWDTYRIKSSLNLVIMWDWN